MLPMRFAIIGWALWMLFAAPAAAQRLELKEDDSTISIYQDGRLVLSYNVKSPAVPKGMDAKYHRSGFIHPVRSPGGAVVTATFPADHPHQHGIFSAWVKTQYEDRAIDFWNLVGGTGRVVHERVVSRRSDKEQVGFAVDLLHRGVNPQVDILRERWQVTAVPRKGHHCFDVESTQTAVGETPLNVKKHHYGGMALRGPMAWLTKEDSYVKRAPNGQKLESNGFTNSRGSDRRKGNHEKTRWVVLAGAVDGRSAAIVVLCHRDNFRAPQAARLHPTKPYFCFAPCFEGAFQISASTPLHSRYRYLVLDEEPDRAWIESQWRAWCGSSE